MDIETFHKLRDDYKKALSNHGKELAGELLLKALEGVPDLVAIRWTQYTPYFCDGDPCTFGVNDMYFKFTDTPEDDGDYEDGFIGSWEIKRGDNKERAKLFENAISLLTKIDDEIMEVAFGDGVRVTATLKDGALDCQVEDYDHD